MKIWAITMVANEEDIIGFNLAHLLKQDLDGIIVADNLSTDWTNGILRLMEMFSDKLHVVLDNDPAHYQGRKMTKLAAVAHEMGADFIIPFDADELWYPLRGGTLGSLLRECPHPVVGVPMWNHWCTAYDRHDVRNPFLRMVWRAEERNPLDKVCFRYDQSYTIGEGNHAILKGGAMQEGAAAGIGIRHFPYRGPEHFVRKADRGGKALAATDLPESVGAHWRQYRQSLIDHGAEALMEHYKRYFYFTDPESQNMAWDPAPYAGEL